MKLGDAFKQKLNELETNVQNLINREKRILKAQEEENLFQSELQKKIDALDGKLHRYLEQSSARDERIRDIEKKIEGKMKKRDELAELQGQLEGLEVMYFKLKRRNIQAPEILGKLQHRIKELKTRIRA